jgi:hypothetical protein
VFDEEEIAKQLTLIDFSIYSAIEVSVVASDWRSVAEAGEGRGRKGETRRTHANEYYSL